MREARILIIGAGIGGLTAAIALGNSGGSTRAHAASGEGNWVHGNDLIDNDVGVLGDEDIAIERAFLMDMPHAILCKDRSREQARAQRQEAGKADGLIAGAVDQPATAKHQATAHRLPTNRVYKIAMRTLTPLATCCSITLRGPSATSEAISTSRFIGPGGMNDACGAASSIAAKG